MARTLVAMGGEDTLGVASKLFKEHKCNVVGVPKTMDNDLSATDFTFGFDTAVNIAMEAIDRLHTTAESHHRALIVEVMGRHAGWIALHAGLAGGASGERGTRTSNKMAAATPPIGVKSIMNGRCHGDRRARGP